MFNEIVGKDGFNEEQVGALSEDLDQDKARICLHGGREIPCLDGWWLIHEANRIFGFGKWDRRTEEMILVHEREIEECYGVSVVNVSYVSKVSITVQAPHAEENIVREATGAGHCSSVNAGLAHEVAAKTAEIDGMKNALMTFGFPFGLGLVPEFAMTAGLEEKNGVEDGAEEPNFYVRGGSSYPTVDPGENGSAGE